MPTAISGGTRIRTNIAAENALNALQQSTNSIANSQLQLSTGKRINSAADDVAGYITSKALTSRNGSLKTSLNSVGDALNTVSIASDALDNVNSLLSTIKDNAATASSGSLGSDEKIALAKASYRLASQVQSIVDSTVFGGKQLLEGSFSGSWVIGYYANNDIITIGVDLTTKNADYNTYSIKSDGTKEQTNNFNLNATSGAIAGNTSNFAGISGLNLESLNQVGNATNGNVDLGIFSDSMINTTISSLSEALNNVNKVASYIGGVQNRLNSQEDMLNSQITNYDAAISRIQDTDTAQTQLDLTKEQFLEQAI
jgi:flagellin